jgi:inner membrane protein COX18
MNNTQDSIIKSYSITQDVALYWTVSSVYGLAQNLVLLSPSFRRFSRIPVTHGERPQPYRHIVNQIKAHRLFQ